MGWFGGLPNDAFKDSSGDKKIDVSALNAWYVLLDLLAATATHFSLFMVGWIALMVGNTLAYHLIMLCSVGISLGVGCWGLYRKFNEEPPKDNIIPKDAVYLQRYNSTITWRMLLWSLGLLIALVIHYVF
jgi:hypothetical protein